MESSFHNDWPPQVNTPFKFKCLRDFNNVTNYKKLYRQVCGICGQINIANQPLIPQPINFLLTHEDILHKNNNVIYYLRECDLAELKYKQPSNVLNDLILEVEGFEENKVVICNDCHRDLKKKKKYQKERLLIIYFMVKNYIL